MSNDVRVIGRKHSVIILRGERFEIYSLSIAGIEQLKTCINVLVVNFFKQAAALPKLQWELQRGKGLLGKFKSKTPPTETIEFINRFLTTIIDDPLGLLEAASKLPHKFFDKDDPENCLTIDEIIAVAEEVMEVNGLNFLLTALKNLVPMMKERLKTPNQNEAEKLSVPSANGMDTPQAE